MSTIFGMIGSGDWSADQEPTDYRSKAFELFGGAPNPFTAILSKLPTGIVTDATFNVFEERLPVMNFTTTGTIASGTAQIDLSGTTPAKGLKLGDMLRDTRTGEVLLVDVAPVSTWTYVHCVRGVGQVAAAQINAGDILEWAGSAYEEGSAAPDAVSKTPDVATNYIQTFKDTCEMTGQALATLIRPDGKPWNREKRKALERHMIKLERAFMFSAKDKLTGSGGQNLYTTGGLLDLVTTNVTDFSSTGVNMDGLEDAFEQLFKYGSKTKMAFIGNKALTILNRVVRNNSQFYFMASQPIPAKQTYGLRVFNFVTPHGELGLIPHPLLNESATYNSWAFIVDPKFAEYVTMPGRDTDYTEKDMRVDLIDKVKGLYQTDAGLRLALEETHGIFKNMLQYVA